MSTCRPRGVREASGSQAHCVKARRCDVSLQLSGEKWMTTNWNGEAARAHYAMAHWGENYFDVDEGGRLIVRPRGAGSYALALEEIVEAARAQGAPPPLPRRFS